MESTTRFSRVRIEERTTDWLLTWDADTGAEDHPTAVDAQRAVLMRDRLLAKSGIGMVTIIDWRPNTWVGREVVKALCAATEVSQ